MARRPLYEKDKAYKRTVQDTKNERDRKFGLLRDFNKGKSVVIFWDFNPKATEDGIFGLKVGKETVYLDAEQVLKFLRWV